MICRLSRALVTRWHTLVSFDSRSLPFRTLVKQFFMRFVSSLASTRILTLAMVMIAWPSIVSAHPGHGGIGAGDHDHLQWLDGFTHSLIALPVVWSSLLFALLACNFPSRSWRGLSWLGAAATGAALAAFHLNAEWAMWQQVAFLTGSCLGAISWYLVGRMAISFIARCLMHQASPERMSGSR